MMRFLLSFAAFVVLAAPVAAADAPAKHVWVVPVNISQALDLRMETKATEALLDKANEQCVDDSCKAKVAECRKSLATCVLVPSAASVHESEEEND